MQRLKALSILSLMLVLLGSSIFVRAQKPNPDRNVASSQSSSSGSLHNPGLDNHDWYEFNNRYGRYVAGSWLPDDDDNVYDNIPLDSRQDWRLWFMNNWSIPETDPEQGYAHQIEAVQMRPYGEGSLLGGIYQVVYNITPCLVYEFSMHGQSRPVEANDHLVAMQVGIQRTGWYLHPTDSRFPAIHNDMPEFHSPNIVWGTPKTPINQYEQMSVQAEAWADRVAVYTYAHTDGGRSHRVFWDTGAFSEVTPATIYDPLQHSATTGGISQDPIANPSGTTANVSWTSTGAAISQIFYHSIAGPATTPPPTLPYTIFLPLVIRAERWDYSLVDKTFTTTHTVTLTGLQSGYTYEYFVVSRGLSSNQCVNWVSSKDTFVMP